MKLNLGELTVTSPAFDHGGAIPQKYSAVDDGPSPELRWEHVPEGTRELVVIVHDPDAPLTDGFTHWVVYGIDPTATGLAEGDTSATQGANTVGQAAYMGPLPPEGHGTHYYFFHLFALDTALDAEPGLDRAEILRRIDDHIIEQARVVGTFER